MHRSAGRRIPELPLVLEQISELVQNDRDGDERVGRVPVPGIAGRTFDVPFRERFVVSSAPADQLLNRHRERSSSFSVRRTR